MLRKHKTKVELIELLPLMGKEGGARTSCLSLKVTQRVVSPYIHSQPADWQKKDHLDPPDSSLASSWLVAYKDITQEKLPVMQMCVG